MRVDQRLRARLGIEHREPLLGGPVGAGDATRDLGHRLARCSAIAAVPISVCSRNRVAPTRIEPERSPRPAPAPRQSARHRPGPTPRPRRSPPARLRSSHHGAQSRAPPSAASTVDALSPSSCTARSPLAARRPADWASRGRSPARRETAARRLGALTPASIDTQDRVRTDMRRKPRRNLVQLLRLDPEHDEARRLASPDRPSASARPRPASRSAGSRSTADRSTPARASPRPSRRPCCRSRPTRPVSEDRRHDVTLRPRYRSAPPRSLRSATCRPTARTGTPGRSARIPRSPLRRWPRPARSVSAVALARPKRHDGTRSGRTPTTFRNDRATIAR